MTIINHWLIFKLVVVMYAYLLVFLALKYYPIKTLGTYQLTIGFNTDLNSCGHLDLDLGH